MLNYLQWCLLLRILFYIKVDYEHLQCLYSFSGCVLANKWGGGGITL